MIDRTWYEPEFGLSGPPTTGPFLERVPEIMRDQLDVFDAGEEVLSGADRSQVDRAREAPGPRTHHSQACKRIGISDQTFYR
jgi:hypothetical protein